MAVLVGMLAPDYLVAQEVVHQVKMLKGRDLELRDKDMPAVPALLVVVVVLAAQEQPEVSVVLVLRQHFHQECLVKLLVVVEELTDVVEVVLLMVEAVEQEMEMAVQPQQIVALVEQEATKDVGAVEVAVQV